MEVIVKNSQLSKTYISKMAYNHVNNILACNIDGNDTVLFFALDKDTMSFQELFKGMSKPPGSKISMTWSPDGRYLALGAHNVELWEYKEGRLKPVRSFQEDFVEIKIIQWSVDSQCYACGGISKTNTIKIRNIETGKVKQLQLLLGQTISSISFDPYGKYLLLQLRNNTIQVYSVINYQRYKSIKLSPQGLRINPIKETRQSSWSPEYSNFICPSLDDSRMNIAINLSRTKDFKSKNIFIGHCTSISCCKFSPKLYKWNGEITAIVAMGDSAGNVSIWRVGSKTNYEQPLLLSNSLQNSMEVVQDIEWDQKGDVLIVNMMKKYVHLIKFIDKQKYFGKELTNQQTTQLILETYGSNRATDVNKKQIEVFDFNVNSWDKIQQEEKKVDEPSSIQIQQISQIPNIPVQNNHFNTLKNTNHQQISAIYSQNKMEIQSEVPEAQTFIPNQTVTPPPQTFRNVLPSILQNPVIHSSDSKGQFVKLSQQKVIIGKNNKKKIQPAMLVRKQQFTQMNMMKSQLSSPFNNQLNHFGQSQQLPSNTHYFMNPMVQTFPSLQLPLITFSQKQLTLPNHRLLEIKRLNKITQLQIQTLQQSSQVQAKFTRLFPSTIDYVFVTGKFLYVINQELLYVFDFQLGLKQLPLRVGKVNSFVANDQGLVAVINCDGYMIAFDHVNNRNKTLAPVPLHLLMKQNFIQQNNAITKFNTKEFIITTNSDLFLTLSTQKTKNKSFLYDIKKNSWVQLSFRQGILTPGYSIKITDNQQAIVKNFFMGICPSLRQKVISSQRVNNSMLMKNKNYGNAVITEEQEKLIYYLKYQPNKQKYYLALLQYIQSLKEARKNKQLRSLLHDYFFNAQGQKYIQNYEDRTQLMQKLKSKISGGVIDEFVLMERELENKL